MKKTLMFLALSILLANFGFALTFDEAMPANGMELPSGARFLLGNQKINVFIDNVYFAAADTANNIIKIQQEAFEEPSLKIYASSATVNSIKASENPSASALNAYKTGKIKIVKIGVMNKLKLGIAGIGARIWSWFS